MIQIPSAIQMLRIVFEVSQVSRDLVVHLLL